MSKQKIVKNSRESIVFFARTKQTAQGAVLEKIEGTGFAVMDGKTIITCAHVINGLKPTDARVFALMKPTEQGDGDYEPLEFEVVNRDDKNDVAAVRLTGQAALKPLKLAGMGWRRFLKRESVRAGESTLTLGFPLPNEFQKTKLGDEQLNMGITLCAHSGMVSNVKRRGADRSEHFYMLDHHINRGVSGSPVISLSTGNVIGVASNSTNTTIVTAAGPVEVPKNIGFCRPVSFAVKLVEDNK